MDAVVRNIDDLRLEIIRLEQKKLNQEIVIKQHFSSPRAILGTITSLFPKRNKVENEVTEGMAGKDIAAWLSKLVLPFTLNKTIFRKSNFIVKALVGIASQKASKFINDKSVAAAWDKIKTVLPESIAEKITPKKKKGFFNLVKHRHHDGLPKSEAKVLKP